MSDQAMPDGPRHEGGWTEVVSTVLLAMAAVATAWSSYQANRWTAEQTKAFSAANASRVEATRVSDLANAETQVDIAVFIQWVDAYVPGERDLANFYRARFRSEFRPAFNAWFAADPFENPDAPLTPFAMPEYSLQANRDADRLQLEAEASASLARTYIQRASNYVLGVVLFAVSLFFAGISTKVATRRLRAVVLSIGCILFLSTAVWIATFPVSISI